MDDLSLLTRIILETIAGILRTSKNPLSQLFSAIGVFP